jgi:hypothetical protein
MEGLALIYNKHLTNPGGVPQATKNAVKWIKDKLLHGYYTPGTKNYFSVLRRVLLFFMILYTPNSNLEHNSELEFNKTNSFAFCCQV